MTPEQQMTAAVLGVGAVCFGITVGLITYRTLVRTEKSAVSDIAAVVGVIGGAVITGLFAPETPLFGWYAIGLLGGVLLYFLLFLILNGVTTTAHVMGGGDGTPPSPGGVVGRIAKKG